MVVRAFNLSTEHNSQIPVNSRSATTDLVKAYLKNKNKTKPTSKQKPFLLNSLSNSFSFCMLTCLSETVSTVQQGWS